MTSPSMLQKIAKARQAAPSELPMACLYLSAHGIE